MMATTVRTPRAPALLFGSTSLLALVALPLHAARADVATDGTLGPRVTLAEPNIRVGADLGQTRGGNLFHSFQRFDVDTGGSVTFTGPGDIKNVIGRVTGGQRSSIAGTLASDIQGANLYLLNPAGILFGPNARLDVKGSFHASTADQLNFADGAVFSALDTAGSTLTVAEPVSFGFLGQNAGQVLVVGSDLDFPQDATLSFTAAEIGVAAAQLGNEAAPLGGGTGRILIAAQRGAGEVPIEPVGPPVPRDGTVVIGAGDVGLATSLNVVGPGNGLVRIEAGELALDGGDVFVVNNGSTDSEGGIQLAAENILLRARPTATGEGGNVVTTALSTGRAGSILAAASDTITFEGGNLVSAPLGPGGGGAVTVDTGGLRMTGGVIGAPQLGAGFGSSGATSVAARDSVEMSDGAFILSASLGDFPGEPLAVSAVASISLTGGSAIAADAFGNGAAGPVSVQAASLALDSSRISASAVSVGDAGSIEIDTESLTLTNGGLISSETADSGEGGAIDLRVGTLTASGDFSGVDASTERQSTGNAGSINVTADTINLSNRAQITSSTSGAGAGGSVFVNAGIFSADGASDLASERLTGLAAATATGSTGAAGTITLDAGSVQLVNGGQISGIVRGEGDGGQIRITAQDLTATGQLVRDGTIIPSAVLAFSETGSAADAGSISVTADTIALADGGRISAETRGAGQGGSVELQVGALTATGGFSTDVQLLSSAVSASASSGSTGPAGSVTIAADSILLTGGGQILGSTFATGAGGSIDIDAGVVRAAGGFVDADGFSFPSGIFASAEAGSTGPGGTIRLAADQLDLQDGGRITGSTQGRGDGGQVQVTADRLTIGREVVLAGRALGSGILATAEQGSTGAAGTVAVQGGDITVRTGGSISGRSASPRGAGEVAVTAGRSVTIEGGTVETNSGAAGAAGDVLVRAPRVAVRGDGLIGSSGSGAGPAGDVRIRAGRLEVRNASIRTEGQGAEGGRIDVAADDRVYLRRGTITSNGIQPEAGASLITLAAPEIVLNASTVTSLTGDGRPLAGSGEASLLGDVTVISADSVVAGSSSVLISGLQTNLGSDLQLPTNVFLDASRLLRDSCAASGGGPRSSFTRGGRGGLPPAPDRPLPSAGAAGPAGEEGRVAAEAAFLEVCGGPPKSETRS